jgi:DNA-binding response OmpR family regulator
MDVKKILIADDERDSVKVLEDFLKAKGFSVIVAYDGLDAIRLTKQNMPDVVILDIMMPFVDGYLACDTIKKDELTKNIPVIILTAKDISKEISTAVSKNADWYVLKPYDRESLLNKINICLMKNSKNQKKA